jgi:acetyl esterase/lipase
MPLAPRFAERLKLFGTMPREEFMKIFGEASSVYESPDLEVKHEKAGNVPLLTYRPVGVEGDLPVLIWMHGGGFQFGTYTMNEGDIVARELAHRGRLVVVNVEYRLVNDKVKFPAPQEDCLAALDWTVENLEKLGARRDAIFVGGISAGGCLAASVSMMDRDRGTHYLKGQLLNVPVAHAIIPPMHEELQSKLDELNGFYIQPDSASQLQNVCAVDGDPSNSPAYCFPGDVEDQSGLPATQIINSEYDSLRASGEKYGEQLKAAGVKTEVLTQLSVPHAHINNLPADLPEMGETMDLMVRFIQQNS